jgi:peptidoglycan hydrolase-like protein with peptidoglycan-binding domain
MPDDYVAFGVAVSGFNSRCWMIAIAAPSAALNADSEFTKIEIDNMAREIVAFWQRNDIDVSSAANFIGGDVKDRPGLAHHGDVQPADRSDAWSRREDRWVFDSLLLQAIERHAGVLPLVPPTPTVPTPIPPQAVWRVGSTGDKVRGIQKIVGVNQDGVYGPQTERAVIQWQKNLRITPDGIWGPATEQATHDLFVFLNNLPAVQETVPNNPFFAANAEIVPRLEDYMDELRKAGDSCGARIDVVAQRVPVGLGEPLFDKLDADIAYAMMGINAVKGVEIGAGFRAVVQKGTEHGDEITPQGFRTNNAGGVLGGISSGQDITVSIAIKPTSSIRSPKQSIDRDGNPVTVETFGRHDPCVGIRATPIAEAMLALVLMDHALRHRAQCGDASARQE